jgi:hypothetical protein
MLVPRERGGANPQMWLWSAERLYYAAEVVWDVAWNAEVAMFQGKRPQHAAASGQYSTSLLLFGYAFENALKGLIVQRLTSDRQTVVTADGKLKGIPTKGHQIVVLAREWARLTLRADEETLLRRLQEYVLWAGRYPVMKDASAYKSGELVPGTLFHPPTDKPLIQVTFEAILANYEKRFVRLSASDKAG